MYKQILVPDKQNHSIKMPEKFFGEKVEVIVAELADSANNVHPKPPAGKKIAADELFENLGSAPDFPFGDEIRSKAWPFRW